MNIYNLRYFVTLARIRQYTKAAEELCITQPSLSHAISQMEKELGVKLFEKNGHKITLTQFGEEFLSYAEKTLDVLDDGIASIKRSAMGNGTIRLGLVRPLGISYVPRMAAAFIKKNPKLDIDFTFHTDVTGRLLDDMQLGKYDLLFCSKPSEEYHFTAEPVMKQRLVLITSKGHPLAKKMKRSINLAETAGYSYVCFDKNSGIRSIFDEMLKKADITVKVAYETEEDQVIAGLVANGFGIAVVPYMDILEKMSVEIFEIESPEYERSFYMVNDNSTYMSPAVETFRKVQNPTLNRARNISEEIIELYRKGELDEVYIIYTSMINAIQEETQIEQLLPLKKADFNIQIPVDFKREELALKPSPEVVMDRIVPDYIVGFVYGALVESFSCEQNARMMAMEAASKSAKDMLHDLDIQYNRARQASITQEITEVIAGAKSQKKKRKK